MIKNGLDIRAFYRGKEIKIVPLQHLSYFFRALSVLSDKWKIEPFTKLWGGVELTTTVKSALNLMPYLIYKHKFSKYYEFNVRRFRNEITFKTKNPKVFLMEYEYLTLTNSEFSSAIAYLKSIGFIKSPSIKNVIRIDEKIFKYCMRLGDYLFDTEYCKKSFENNTHYFGDSNSSEHSEAYEERKELDKQELN